LLTSHSKPLPAKEQTVETRSDSVFASEMLAGQGAGTVADVAQVPHRLPAKGSCWYCDKPLDSVRRFCGKGCSAAFDEDAALHG
jgi:hypothetical protein